MGPWLSTKQTALGAPLKRSRSLFAQAWIAAGLCSTTARSRDWLPAIERQTSCYAANGAEGFCMSGPLVRWRGGTCRAGPSEVDMESR